jgi:hypothetical protein
MNKIYAYFSALALLILPFVVQSQDFSYKVERDIKIEFSHVFDPAVWGGVNSATLQVEAPKPIIKDNGLKAKLDYLRALRYPSHRRSTEIPVGDDILLPDTIDGYVGSIGAGTPNDNHMAVSNGGKVVSVLNQEIICLTEKGTMEKTWALFFMSTNFDNDKPEGPLPSLLRTYDPKVIYDPLNDRFIIVFLNGVTSGDSRIVVCFSQTNDPSGKWNVYSVTGNPLSQNKIWTDYPIIATTKEDFFVTINLLEEGKSWQEGFTQSIIWQIGKKEGYNGDTLNSNYWHDIKYKDKSVWSICPVQGGMKQAEKEIYFLSVRPGDQVNDTVFLHHISNTLSSGSAEISLRQLKTDIEYGYPPSAYQPVDGFRLQTNDTRVLSGFIHGDMIQYVQTTINPINMNPSVYHGTIFNLGSSDETVKGKIISRDSFDYAYPSICYAGEGGLDRSSLITFSHSSKWHFPGTSAIYMDRHGEYSSILTVKAGDSHINSFINDSMERWGDYTSTQRRYNNSGEIWVVGSFGNNLSRTSTWVSKLKLNDDRIASSPIEQVNVFPVPASQQINIELYSREGVTYEFVLHDMEGREVFSETRENLESGLNLIKIGNIRTLSGMYVLSIRANNSELKSVKIPIF